MAKHYNLKVYAKIDGDKDFEVIRDYFGNRKKIKNLVSTYRNMDCVEFLRVFPNMKYYVKDKSIIVIKVIYNNAMIVVSRSIGYVDKTNKSKLFQLHAYENMYPGLNYNLFITADSRIEYHQTDVQCLSLCDITSYGGNKTDAFNAFVNDFNKLFEEYEKFNIYINCIKEKLYYRK